VGPTPPGHVPPAGRPDTAAFFREYYKRLPAVPKGRTDDEVNAFEARYGKATGYTRSELDEIAKAVRADLRRTGRTAANGGSNAPTSRVGKWERWIRGIGFGSFALAALGVIFYALVIRKGAASWPELTPYVIGIIILAGVLLILDYGMQYLRPSRAHERVAQVVTAVCAVLFLLIVTLGVAWLGVFILRDAGLLPGTSAADGAYFLIMPSNEFVRDLEISYDIRSTLRRLDNKDMGEYHFVEDRGDRSGILKGVGVRFSPGEDYIDAEMFLPYRVKAEDQHLRVRLSRTTRTFDKLRP
jgi:hypothetical protein